MHTGFSTFPHVISMIKSIVSWHTLNVNFHNFSYYIFYKFYIPTYS